MIEGGTKGKVLNEPLKSIKQLETTDPSHANNFNAVFQQLIDNDVTMAEDTGETVKNIRINIIDMAIELETLKNATLNGVTANMFVETFINLNDITLAHGTHDATNEKVYLK